MTRVAFGLALALAVMMPTSRVRAEDAAPVVGQAQLIERWLRSGTEVASWRAQVGSARFDVLTAKLWPNPELSLAFDKNVAGTPPNAVYGYEAQLTMPLPIFGQIGARRAAAEAQLSVAEVTALGTIWDRANDIQTEMVNQAFADARVAMLERGLTELERLHGIIEVRTRAGANSEYDVLRVTTSEATARAAINTAKTERNASEAKLVALIADPSLVHARITRASLAPFHGPTNETALVEAALSRRPDLELARRNVAAGEKNASRYRREAIPIPSLFVGTLLAEQAYGVQITAGLSFPLPLFDRNQGLIGRSLNEAQTNQLLGQALETRVRAEVRGAWRARESARAALREFRQASLPAATEMIRRAEVTYQAGKFSVAELFDAYRTIWELRSQELELERQVAVAETALARAAVLFPLSARP